MEAVLIGAGGSADDIIAHLGIVGMKCFVDRKYYVPNDKNIHPLDEFDPSTWDYPRSEPRAPKQGCRITIPLRSKQLKVRLRDGPQ